MPATGVVRLLDRELLVFRKIWYASAFSAFVMPLLFLVALILVFGLAMAPAAGVTGALFAMAFDADVRYSGVSIGYTLSQVVGSAFAPTVAAALYNATKNSDAIVGYLIAVSVVSAVSVCLMPGPWRARPARTDVS